MITTDKEAKRHARHHMHKASHVVVTKDGQVYLCSSAAEMARIKDATAEETFNAKGTPAPKPKPEVKP